MKDNKEIKYFDYTATTPVDDDVLNTYINTTKKFFANTTSLHLLGEESKHMYDKCINTIKDVIGVKKHNLVFTSNATEANNLAIQGIAYKYEKGKIITTKEEHPSVYNTIKNLSDKYEVVYLDIKEDGRVDIEELKKELNSDTILVSIMWVNNILGTINDIKSIIKEVKKYPKCHLHVDCVQGFCKVIPDFDFDDVDLFTFSTHKLYGPKGIGGLFFKETIDLNKRLFGSNAQYSVKPGTLDVSLIAASAKCFMKFYPKTEEMKCIVKAKFDYLYDKLKNISGVIMNTPKENISYYIINISIPPIKGETMVHMLEAKHIYVSTGSSCSSKLENIEKTIYAQTNDKERALSSIRISLSYLVLDSELDDLISEIKNIINR